MNRRDLEKVHVAIPQLVDELESGKLNRREFLRTTTLLGLSSTAAYAVVGAITGEGVVSTAQAQTGNMGGTLKVSMVVQDISDPAVFDWSEKGNIARQVIEPMTQVGADNVTRPYLAEGWEANDDLTEWTFRLRKDAVWNNGDKFGAEDVIATFERWLDPATGSSNQGRFSSLTTKDGDSTVMAPGAITKVDDNTVRFRLNSPSLSLPESMGDYPALITHRDFAADGANLIANPIGTGPFELKEHGVGERAVLTKRDPSQYWGDEVYLDGITYIDHGDDPAAGLSALASGQVDLLNKLNVEQVAAVRSIPTLDLYETVTGQTGVARMRVVEAPFDNLKLRQAIRACIDHQRVLELAYQGLGAPGEDHHVCEVHPEYAKLPEAGSGLRQGAPPAGGGRLPERHRPVDRLCRLADLGTGLMPGDRGDAEAGEYPAVGQHHAGRHLLGPLDVGAVRLHLLDPPPAWGAGPGAGLSQRRGLERDGVLQSGVRRPAEPCRRHPRCGGPTRYHGPDRGHHAERLDHHPAVLAGDPHRRLETGERVQPAAGA